MDVGEFSNAIAEVKRELRDAGIWFNDQNMDLAKLALEVIKINKLEKIHDKISTIAIRSGHRGI